MSGAKGPGRADPSHRSCAGPSAGSRHVPEPEHAGTASRRIWSVDAGRRSYPGRWCRPPTSPGACTAITQVRWGSVVGARTAGATGAAARVALRDVAAVADQRAERHADRDQALRACVAAGTAGAAAVVVVAVAATGHRRPTG